MARCSAFVAATPFQVVNAMSLAYTQQRDAPSEGTVPSERDLYVVGGFARDFRIVSRLITEEGFFEHVFFVPGTYDAYGRGLMSATGEEFLSWIDFLSGSDCRAPLLQEGYYGQLFFSLPTMTAEMLVAMNPSAKITLFDDGYGSYFSDILRAGGWSGRYPDELRLLRPEMCRSHICANIEELDMPLEDFAFSSAMNNVMSYIPNLGDNGENTRRYPRFAYLSQPYPQEKLVPGVDEQIKRLLTAFPGDSIVKPHPREDEEEISQAFGDSMLVDARGHSMEVLCLNGEIGDDNVLVGTFSTAQYVPALMFGARPYLLFLYELMLEDDEQKEEIGKLVGHLFELYGDSPMALAKICVARSWDDARHFLRRCR